MNADREERLDQIIADYLQKCDEGEAVAPEELIEAYPEFRNELRKFLLDHMQMQGLAGPLAVPMMTGRPVPAKLRYFGDYELLEEVARGGMGIVYRARQTTLNRTVAVKMILGGRLASHADERRFQIEAEAAANLKHPNIVAVHEVGRHDGQHYFSMEFVDGKNLSQLTHDQPLPIEKSVDYLIQIAEAVHYAHERGTLHRDLKPSNVLIDHADQVQITDFGLAMQIESESDLTKTGQTLGTPGYMPPEQAKGWRELIGPRSDVYSLGAILYDLLTGRPPFRGASPVDTLRLLIDSEPISPRLLNRTIPRDLETICLKCLEKDFAKRYASADELAQDLRSFRNGEPIHARPIGAVARSWRWCRRKPALAGLSAALTLAILTTIVGLGVANVRVRGALQERTEALDDLRAQKKISDDALHDREQALEARGRAIADRDDALKRLQWQTYVRGIVVAQHEYESGNIVAADRVLEDCGPEPNRSFEWHYLKDLCRDLAVNSREGRIPSGALSAEGHSVVHSNGAFRIWSGNSSTPIATIPVAKFTHAAVISPDGRWFALQVHRLRSNEIRVFALAGGTLHRVIKVDAPGIQARSMAFSRDGRQIAALHSAHPSQGPREAPDRLTVWDIATGRKLRTTAAKEFRRRIQGLSSRAVGLCGNLRLVVTRDCVYDTQTNRVVRRFDRPVQGVAFSRDSRQLAVSNFEGLITILEPATGRVIGKWTANRTDLTTIAFHPDGRQLAAGGRNGLVQVWDIETGAIVFAVQAGVKLHQMAFDPKRRQITTAHREVLESGTVRVWTARRPDVLVLKGHTRRYYNWGHTPAFSPDARFVAAIDETENVVVRESVTGHVVTRLPAGSGAHRAAFSQDGSLLAAVGSRGFRIWSFPRGRLIHDLKARDAKFHTQCCFSHDGRHFVGCHQRGATVWNLKTGRVVKRFRCRGRFFSNVGFSRDDRLLFATSERNEGYVWTVSTWKQRCKLQLPEETQRHAALSPDGRVLATASFHRGVTLLDTDTGKRLQVHEFEGGSRCVDFSRDGKRLLTASENDVQIRDRASGQLLLTLKGHRNRVSRALFSPDGRRIISTSSDGEVFIWGAATHRPTTFTRLAIAARKP